MQTSVQVLADMQDAYGVSLWVVLAASAAVVVIFQLLGSSLWLLGWGKVQQTAKLPRLLVLFFHQVLGMGASMLALLGLACAGIFQLSTVVVLIATVLVLAAWSAWQRPPPLHHDTVTGWEWAILLCAALSAAMMAWRFPGHWDDTAYHLPMARAIVEHHGLFANEWLRFPYFPAYAQLLFAAGLLLDASLAQWLAIWPVVVTLLGLMGASQWLAGHSGWGLLAGLLYISRPWVQDILGFSYVDMTLTLFCTASTLAAALWARQQKAEPQNYQWLILSALCAGIAGGIKLHGLVAMAAVGVAVLCFSGSPRQAVRNLVLYGLVGMAVCSFWYVRSYWLTGDPIHPAGGRLFGYYLWSAQDLARQMQEQATHGVPKHWSNLGLGLNKVQAAFLGAIFFVPLFRWGRSPAWCLLWLPMALLLLFWFWVSQVSRYLMPVLPLGSLLVLMLLHQLLTWGHRKLWPTLQAVRWWSFMISAGLLVLAMRCLWLSGADLAMRSTPLQQSQSRDEVVLLERAEALEDLYGTRVLNLGYENAFFYYKGQLIGDWFGPASFFHLAQCLHECRLNSAQDVQQMMHKLGARMVLIHAQRFHFDKTEFSAQFQLIENKGSGYLYALKE